MCSVTWLGFYVTQAWNSSEIQALRAEFAERKGRADVRAEMLDRREADVTARDNTCKRDRAELEAHRVQQQVLINSITNIT